MFPQSSIEKVSPFVQKFSTWESVTTHSGSLEQATPKSTQQIETKTVFIGKRIDFMIIPFIVLIWLTR
jgi:hypothetical protein